MNDKLQHLRNVPHIYFDGNPIYTNSKLKDLTIFIKDGTHASFNDTPDSDYRYLLSAKNIKKNNVIFDDNDRKITIEDYNSIFKNYNLVDGDILVTIVGSIGELAIVSGYKGEYALQRSVAILRCNEIINNHYLKYYLETKNAKKEFIFRQNASAQGGLYLNELSKITINYPDHYNQLKIANSLGYLENKIFLLEQKIENLKLFKKGYIRTELSNNKSCSIENLNKLIKKNHVKNSELFAEPASVGSLGVRKRSEVYKHELSNDYSKNILFKKNQLCFGIGTDNIVYGLSTYDDILCVSPAYKVFDVKEIVRPILLKEILDYNNKKISHKYMIISARQGKSVDFDGLLRHKFSIPTMSRQISIEKNIILLTKMITNVELQLENLKLFKKGLLQQMFV